MRYAAPIPHGRVRAPHLPTLPLFVGGALGLGGVSGVGTALWLHAATVPDFLVAFLSTGLTGLAALPAYPLLRALGAVAPAARDGGAGHWRWVAYYGLFIGLMAVESALRGWLIGHWFGWPTTGLEHWVRYAGPVPVVWLLVGWAEREAAARAYAVSEEGGIRAEIDRLFDSREALALARARRVDQVGASLAGKVEPRLAAAEQAIAALRARAEAGSPVPAVMLAAVRAELEAVGEGEFRGLSHVLHPSIVQVGLIPSLSSLVARYEGTLPVQLGIVIADLALPPATVLAVYRVAEAALDNARQHAAARAVRVHVGLAGAGRLRLEIADDGVGFDPASARHGVGFAAIDGRVALARGQWGVVAAPGAGTRLWAELPFG